MVDDHDGGGGDGVVMVQVVVSGIVWNITVDGHETGPPLMYFLYNSLYYNYRHGFLGQQVPSKGV